MEDAPPGVCAGDIFLRAAPLNREIAKEIDRNRSAGVSIHSCRQCQRREEALLFSLGVLREQVIAIDPKNANAYFNRGLAHARAKQYEAAIDDYTKALEIDPESIEARNGRAWLRAAQRHQTHAGRFWRWGTPMRSQT